MVEHSTADREVPGSNPGAPFNFFYTYEKYCVTSGKQTISYMVTSFYNNYYNYSYVNNSSYNDIMAKVT